MKPRLRILAGLAFGVLLASCGASHAGGTPEWGYQVVRTFPHDPQAFTQGLVYLNGFLYEGTGLAGFSTIRKVKLETGEVLQKQEVPDQYFGEGIVNWKGKLLELTWQSHVGFVYDLSTFAKQGEFAYPGEGWGLTQDGKRIIMTDGTSQIRFWEPETLKETGRITVTDNGQPVDQLNEVEFVKGEIFANIWQTNRIARIDPASGKVTGWIVMTGLAEPNGLFVEGEGDVLNGIAYDAQGDRLFVTGKKWPKLFEIKLVKKAQ